ncbi:MAG: glucose-6-phosphate dehydrogenase [Rhodobacteraceae bacterium]|nr:glucose-6-phosphate dehydrogenase [Paracoccaceae bacterium]
MYKIIPVRPFDLALFGATGDLAKRQIFPALYRRFQVGQMPPGARILGLGRSQLGSDEFRNTVCQAIREHVSESMRDRSSVDGFLKLVDYISLDATKTDDWRLLASRLDDTRIRAFYLSVRPGIFGSIISNLKGHQIVNDGSRIVVEKPFGHDLKSAMQLNAVLASVFDETQVFRIDHYLGKETVQNLMALRFANVLFEPLWNSQYVDHVQITVAEKIGVSGRGEYYQRAGALRDMVQNHLMQLLCLVAMEPPAKFLPDAVRDEKLKVIRALEAVEHGNIVRGQYKAGPETASFAEDIGDATSETESFVALKCHVRNWRWAGTPFYLRTGKRLRCRMSEIAVAFKDPPHSIFGDRSKLKGNVLAVRLQPDEGIDMRLTIKEPGPGGMRLIDVPLDMSFARTLAVGSEHLINAYERLIMDVIRGDQTLFMRGDEIEAAWAWTDDVINIWAEYDSRPIRYFPGSSGPDDALMLLHRDNRRWREIS